MATKTDRLTVRLDSKDTPIGLRLDSFSADRFKCIGKLFNHNASETVRAVIGSLTGCETGEQLREYAKVKGVSIQRIFEVGLERYNK